LWNGPEYDCQKCGACCIQMGSFDGTSYVYLDRGEARNMRRLGLTVVRSPRGHSTLGCRRHLGAQGQQTCVAFEGIVGDQCGCSIYEDRPGVCRAFQVGEDLCREARAAAGLPV